MFDSIRTLVYVSCLFICSILFLRRYRDNIPADYFFFFASLFLICVVVVLCFLLQRRMTSSLRSFSCVVFLAGKHCFLQTTARMQPYTLGATIISFLFLFFLFLSFFSSQSYSRHSRRLHGKKLTFKNKNNNFSFVDNQPQTNRCELKTKI